MFKYRINASHNLLSTDLGYTKEIYENRDAEEKILSGLHNKGFSFIRNVDMCMSADHYEITLITDEEIPDNKLDNVIKFFGNSAELIDYIDYDEFER